MEGFDACVLPALKEFAELANSLLEIQNVSGFAYGCANLYGR